MPNISKTDEFLGKFQTAFGPPLIFGKLYWGFCDKNFATNLCTFGCKISRHQNESDLSQSQHRINLNLENAGSIFSKSTSFVVGLQNNSAGKRWLGLFPRSCNNQKQSASDLNCRLNQSVASWGEQFIIGYYVSMPKTIYPNCLIWLIRV